MYSCAGFGAYKLKITFKTVYKFPSSFLVPKIIFTDMPQISFNLFYVWYANYFSTLVLHAKDWLVPIRSESTRCVEWQSSRTHTNSYTCQVGVQDWCNNITKCRAKKNESISIMLKVKLEISNVLLSFFYDFDILHPWECKILKPIKVRKSEDCTDILEYRTVRLA